jgi:ubiquinone/menaquinone biosynthesis C-methylase UbiE
MMPRLVNERIRESRFPVHQDLHDASDRMPYPDSAFDTVVTTFTVCSIKNVQAALKEIGRVLKPAGVYLFLEHGRSEDRRIARFQDRLNPIQNIIGAGCNLNRKIDQLISDAGFEIIELRRSTMANTPRLFGEVYSGIAGWKKA